MNENIELKFNPRYPPPSEDVQEKIRMSFDMSVNIETRYMKCPVCGFKVAKIPISQSQLVYVKCKKCKFEGPLSPAHFRRKKHYRPTTQHMHHYTGEKPSLRFSR